MRFGELRMGDFFDAFGATFLKLPPVVSTELPDANAVNTGTGQLACFGPTVPVERAAGVHFEQRGGNHHASKTTETALFRLGNKHSSL